VHVLGLDADVVADVLAAEALLATASAAHAPLEAAVAARIVAANMPSFVIGSPPASTRRIVNLKKPRQFGLV
jgi:hypothetical protein